MRKEARHTQRRDRASGVPPDILEHLPPNNQSLPTLLLCALASDFTEGCLCYSYKASFCPSVSQTKPLRAPSNQKQSVSWGWRQWTCVLAPRFSTTGIEQACSLQQALVSGCPRLGISVPVYGTLIHETVSGLKSRALVSSLNSDTTWPCVFGQPT